MYLKNRIEVAYIDKSGQDADGYEKIPSGACRCGRMRSRQSQASFTRRRKPA